MTRVVLVTSLCILTLAACGRTVVRETVVERPVVKETVVERPVVRETVVERPAVAIAPPMCSIAGMGYAANSLSCQAGLQYRCVNGAWERIPNTYC